jgi:hypothetical protein
MLWYVVRDTAFFLLSLYLFLNTCLLKREGDESASRPSCKNAL